MLLPNNYINGEISLYQLKHQLNIPHIYVAPRPILDKLVRRYRDFTESLPLRVAVGTYNINGGKHFRSIVYRDVSIVDWLDAYKNKGEN